MFYKVTNGSRLEGWRNLPTGLRSVRTGETSFLPREEYSLLLHMNGREDMSAEHMNRKQQETLRKLLAEGILEESSGPFPESRNALYTFYDNIYMDSVQWGITGRCNYSCRHCFVSAPRSRTEDLSTEKCLDIIRQIAQCGIRKLSLTGGEPLIRPDLPELLHACTDADIRVTELYTNGALLTPEVLEQFIRMGQRPRIQVSYDGIGWHDWMRGREGAQKIAENALRLSHEAGLPTTAAMSLFRDNIPAIRETVLRLSALCVDKIKIAPMFSLGLWGENYSDKTLSNEEHLRVVLNYIPDFIADGKPCSMSIGGYLAYIKKDDLFTAFLAKNPETPAPLYPCPAAANSFFISSDGTVLPCMQFAGMPEYASFPNLRDTPLKQILQDSILLKTARTKLQDVYAQNQECMQCPERGKHCGESCRACARPGFCGIDKTTCSFVRNGWFRQVQEAVEKAGSRFSLL